MAGISSHAISKAMPGPALPASASTVHYLLTPTLADFRRRQLWGAEIKQNPPTVTYGEVMDSESGMGKLTSFLVWTSLSSQ